MKKLVLVASVFMVSIIFTACGGRAEKKADIQVASEMQDFMNNFNGRSASVKIALDDFRVSGLDRKDMDMYDLEKPKVLETKGNCYLLECTSGLTKRKYNICWEGGKINSVEDKGME